MLQLNMHKDTRKLRVWNFIQPYCCICILAWALITMLSLVQNHIVQSFYLKNEEVVFNNFTESFVEKLVKCCK